MAAQPNPYTPGAGDRPRVLVGRGDQLALAESVRTQTEAAYAANCLIFTGLRGVGKTVLLKEVADQLTARGWFTTYVQIRRSVGVDKAFAEVALRSAKDLRTGTKIRRSLTQLAKRGGGLQVLGSGAAVGPGGRAPDGYLALSSVLESLGEAARDDGVGVALVVDELQSLSRAPLADLIQLVQDLRDRVPLAFIGGGLPYLPTYIAKVATSTERFRYEPTDFLIDPDARRVVTEPALLEGVTWSDAALDAVVDFADGYPYFLQLYASETWNEAARGGQMSLITPDHVDRAAPVVRRLLEHGMYESRFGQTTPTQRSYLYAMIDLMGTDDHGEVHNKRVRSGDVSRALSRLSSSVSPTREALIRSGAIHAPDHGDLEFSIPGFAQYLARRRAAGDE